MTPPSKSSFISSLAITALIVLSGAWLASGMTPAVESTTDGKEPLKTSASFSDSSPSTAETETALTVTVTGVRSTKGTVHVAVYDNVDAYNAYDYAQAVGYAQLPATKSDLTHTFEELKTGPYAVVIFHDENNNQDFDMSGDIPEEGYGTSGGDDPYAYLSFRQASVKADRISVPMFYLE